jgi:hypothetical protein
LNILDTKNQSLIIKERNLLIDILSNFPAKGLINKELEKKFVSHVEHLIVHNLNHYVFIIQNKVWPVNFCDKLSNYYLLGGRSAYSNEIIYQFSILNCLYEKQNKSLYEILTKNILCYPKIQKYLNFIREFTDGSAKHIELRKYFHLYGNYEFNKIPQYYYDYFGFDIESNIHILYFCSENEFKILDEKKQKIIIEYEYYLSNLCSGIPSTFYPMKKRYEKNLIEDSKLVSKKDTVRSFNQIKDTYSKRIKVYEKRNALYCHQFLFTDKDYIDDNTVFNQYYEEIDSILGD